jgi:hypothetical protein
MLAAESDVAVAAEVSRSILLEELEALRPVEQSYGWESTLNLDALTVSVKMRAHNLDPYIIEVQLDNYKEWPPFFEFVDPDSGHRATRHAYPRSTDSFFHDSGPCICAPFNRKAYKKVVTTGPHEDWSFGEWMTSRANNFDWSHAQTLGDMLLMIQMRISSPELYRGRMG